MMSGMMRASSTPTLHCARQVKVVERGLSRCHLPRRWGYCEGLDGCGGGGSAH